MLETLGPTFRQVLLIKTAASPVRFHLVPLWQLD